MIFLANENVPGPSISLLREAGLDVLSIAESYPGESDPFVLELASKTGRVILTLDSDYGSLIYLHRMVPPPAVIYFREKGQSPTFISDKLLELLVMDEVLIEGKFTVVETENIRQRSLPA